MLLLHANLLALIKFIRAVFYRITFCYLHCEIILPSQNRLKKIVYVLTFVLN